MPMRQTDTFHLNLDSHTLLRFNTRLALFSHAQVAQSVEQRIENPRVGGSIPPLGTNPLFLAVPISLINPSI